MHSVVYDLIHQILTGRVDGTLNRELTVALFRDAHLMQRIVDGQKRNDAEKCVLPHPRVRADTTPRSSKPKGVRLGYMGHLTLISEDVVSALEHYPPDLRLAIAQHAPQPAWDEYVTGRYNETKKKDTSLLGGGKPVVSAGGARRRVDGEEAAAAAGPSRGVVELKSEFRRGNGATPARESSADFGPAPMDDDDDDDDDEPGSAGLPQVRSICTPAGTITDCSLSLRAIWRRRCSRPTPSARRPRTLLMTRTTRTALAGSRTPSGRPRRCLRRASGDRWARVVLM